LFICLLTPKALPINVYPNHQLQSKQDPEGYVTYYDYDETGKVTTATDPNAVTRQIAFPGGDDSIRTSTFTEKDGGAWTYSYDVTTGLILTKTAPDDGVTPGQMRTTRYTYYDDYRQKSKTEPGTNGIRLTTFYSYDSAGHRATISEPLDMAASGIDPASINEPATNSNTPGCRDVVYLFTNSKNIANSDFPCPRRRQMRRTVCKFRLIGPCGHRRLVS
jgi:YD repeat-containing protein